MVLLDALPLGLFTMDCVWDYLRWIVFGIIFDGFDRWIAFGIISDGLVRWLY
jgi:hypothetical protein